MQTILVIGSNSFSGASFVDFALNQGVKVTGTSRSEEPIKAMLPYKWRDHRNFNFHQLDLNQHLSEIVKLVHDLKPEYIVNFAAQSEVAPSWENPHHWFQTNAVSLTMLANLLKDKKCLKK